MALKIKLTFNFILQGCASPTRMTVRALSVLPTLGHSQLSPSFPLYMHVCAVSSYLLKRNLKIHHCRVLSGPYGSADSSAASGRGPSQDTPHCFRGRKRKSRDSCQHSIYKNHSHEKRIANVIAFCTAAPAFLLRQPSRLFAPRVSAVSGRRCTDRGSPRVRTPACCTHLSTSPEEVPHWGRNM